MGYNNMVDTTKSYDFLRFIKFFGEKEQRILKIFNKYVIDKAVIPYKIRSKDFRIEVMSTPAFSAYLIFKNVLIEDGRHPKELLLSNPSGEVIDGKYRFKFTNLLAREGTVREGSFIFDGVETAVDLWNYNFNMVDLTQTPDKLPWRLICEPIESLIHKHVMLGADYLNDCEMNHYEVFRFLYKYITLYLSDETVIGFGKSNLRYNSRMVIKRPLDFRMINAAKTLFDECDMPDLTELSNGDEQGSLQFFEAFIWLITQKDGKAVYDYASRAIDKCSRDYPNINHLLPVYSEHYNTIKNTLNTVFLSRHWEGSYPHYRKKERPKFIETFNVYERKYTYINEKEKMICVSFIESIVEGELVITVIKGSILLRHKNREQLLKAKAFDCFFTDGGKRTCKIVDSITIRSDNNQEDIQDSLVRSYKRI